MIALIRDNTQVPLIEIAGIRVRPGNKYHLGYKKKKTIFLSSPYTTCTKTVPSSMAKLYENFNGADYGYSATVCMWQCRQSYT